MTPLPSAEDDRRWMAAALALAGRGLGRVAPNPAVGCILVRDGMPVGRGWTQAGGRPHAETEALRRAGPEARGATAYVTLEPCSHIGETGPCAVALIEASVSRVVVALQDPDARVAGRGIALLREAGIPVDVGIHADQARELNGGFLSHRERGYPLVTLKLATSLDGRIATAGGESQWITGPEARADAHVLRARHDAILVGIGTALADDPRLTVRLPGIPHQPMRILLDRKGRLPETASLRDGGAPTIQFIAEGLAPEQSATGLEQVAVPQEDGSLSIKHVLSALAARNVTRLMIEGGGRVAASFLNAGMVDRLVWYRAGIILGAGGLPGIGILAAETLADMPGFDHAGRRQLGADRVDELYRR